MKMLSKVGLALLVMVMGMMVFTGCDRDSGVDFRSHSANAAFFIDNHTTEDLVAFNGSVSEGTMLGGIRRGATNHGIWKNPEIFRSHMALQVVFVTYDQFTSNRNTLGVLNNNLFARIFVFYNHGPDNPVRFIVPLSGMLGGDHRLQVQNTTGLDAEIRLEHNRGAGARVVGFAPTSGLTTLPLRDGNIIRRSL